MTGTEQLDAGHGRPTDWLLMAEVVAGVLNVTPLEPGETTSSPTFKARHLHRMLIAIWNEPDMPERTAETDAVLEQLAMMAVRAHAEHGGKDCQRSGWSRDPANAGKPSVNLDILFDLATGDGGKAVGVWLFDTSHAFIEQCGRWRDLSFFGERTPRAGDVWAHLITDEGDERLVFLGHDPRFAALAEARYRAMKGSKAGRPAAFRSSRRAGLSRLN